jgi:hypothetical protein
VIPSKNNKQDNWRETREFPALLPSYLLLQQRGFGNVPPENYFLDEVNILYHKVQNNASAYSSVTSVALLP